MLLEVVESLKESSRKRLADAGQVLLELISCRALGDRGSQSEQDLLILFHFLIHYGRQTQSGKVDVMTNVQRSRQYASERTPHYRYRDRR